VAALRPRPATGHVLAEGRLVLAAAVV
jgi:hypothetical protein